MRCCCVCFFFFTHFAYLLDSDKKKNKKKCERKLNQHMGCTSKTVWSTFAKILVHLYHFNTPFAFVGLSIWISSHPPVLFYFLFFFFTFCIHSVSFQHDVDVKFDFSFHSFRSFKESFHSFYFSFSLDFICFSLKICCCFCIQKSKISFNQRIIQRPMNVLHQMNPWGLSLLQSN